uniref:Phage protein n=1 Tax=Strongyloides venezuelensis TaxID=75913 RepID=A0A0K0G201_STRVS
MIKYFVENNPDLDKYVLYLETFKTYKMVVETIVKEKLSRRCNDCSHKHVSLFLDTRDFDEIFELLCYFNSEEFPYNGSTNEFEDFLYDGSLECPVCGGFDSIKIYDVDEYDYYDE